MRHAVLVLGIWLAAPGASAAELFVGGAGDPHPTIQSALEVAVDGDVITVRAGTYTERLGTRRAGVTVRAEAGAAVLVRTSGRVLDVDHARTTIEGVVFDGEYGASDAIVIEDAASGTTLRDVEVRRSGRDCIDIRGPADVTIEGSRIHHCLWSSAPMCADPACREDAHGIVAGPVRNLTIRGTEVHTFSGDAFQVDPGRDAAGWSGVRIESSRFWLEPLPAAEGGYAAGVVPGENAVDTKIANGVAPGVLTITDVIASGFRGGLIGNMAAFNLKENIEVTLDHVSVSNCEIAFRLRGMTSSSTLGADVTIRNAVVWDVDTGVRYEDTIMPVTLQNVTFGGAVMRPFVRASAPSGVITSANVLLLGDALSAEAMGPGSRTAVAADFANAAAHDYHLADGSAAIDTGERIDAVMTDRDGTPRPQGSAWDVGAYEHCSGAACATPPDAGPIGSGDAGPPVDSGPPVDAGPRPDTGPGSARDAGERTGGEDEGGCGCTIPGSREGRPSTIALPFLAFAVVLLRRRRTAAAHDARRRRR